MKTLSANQAKELPDLSQFHIFCIGTYLGNNSLSCAVVFKKEVVSLDEELASVFFFCRCPLSPQNKRTLRALLLQHTVFALNKKTNRQTNRMK